MYDILLFTETKTDKFDVLKLPNDYSYFSKSRKKFSKKSGGIVIVFKKVLSKFLKFINSDSEYIQWIDISKEYSTLNENVLLGCTYIPPEYTKYSSEEAFIEIEEELILFSQNTKNISIIGDFNSRTSKLNDYIVDDLELLDILDVVDDKDYIDNVLNKLEEKNIPLERYSQDVGRVNKYGTKLLELCKRCNLFIGNGRLFSDKGIGRTTCKDASLVDYLLLSPSIFDIITDFEIVEFDPMFSDVHNRIHFTLSFPKDTTNHDDTSNTCIPVSNPRVRWNPNKSSEYVQVL